MSNAPVLTIDVVSDLVSPWCYLAQGRLRRALEAVDGACVPRVRWQPYEINPAIGRRGMDVDAYLESVFGSTRAGREVLADVTSAGEEEGIRFDFDRVASVPNTRDAHRLILLAEEQDSGERLTRALFRGFFERGLDIGDVDVLSGLAADEGLDATATHRYLLGDRNRDTVRARQAQAQVAGLTGVPGTVFNSRYAVMGVQEPEVLVAAMDRALFDDLDLDIAAVH